MAERIGCDMCLEVCQEDGLEEHRKMCMARLMLRCTICDMDFVSKEALWNHLDRHEIADESKELHYQDIGATSKVYQCTLCYDQRAYQENICWKHKEHDDFFLRCSNCAESFRSQTLKTDHDLTHCKAREQTVAGGLEADQKSSSKVLPMHNENKASLVSYGEMSENAFAQLDLLQEDPMNESLEVNKFSKINIVDQQGAIVPKKINDENYIDSRLTEILDDADLTDNNMTEKESEVLPIASLKSRSKTKVDAAKTSQIMNSEQSLVDCNRKPKDMQSRAENSLRVSSETKCSHCVKEFVSVKSLSKHIDKCHKPTTCDICGTLLYGKDTARYHKKTKHMEPTHKCVNCQMKFYKESHYQEHLHICDCSEKRLPCKLCGQMLKNLGSLKWHMRRVHHIEGDLSEFLTGSMSGNQHHEQKKTMQIDLNQKTSILQHEDRCQSTITDCLDMSQHAEDSEPYSINCSGQSSALTQKKRTDTHRDIDSKNAFTSFEREEIGPELIEYSPANPHQARDINYVTKKKTKANPIKRLKGSSETKALTDNSLQPPVENPLSGSSNTKCAHCGKEYSGFFALARHIEKVHVPHACDVCGITFSSFMKARYHKITRHMGPKHKCPHCPKLFLKEKHYHTHLSNCAGRRIPCKLCGRMLKHSASMKSHMRQVHHIEGDLSELTIGSMSHKQHQKQKQTKQHPITSTKVSSETKITAGKTLQPLIDNLLSGSSDTKCAHCVKEFSDCFSLARHIERNHTPHTCNVCGITFSSFSKAHYHKLTKHLEAKYKCPHCPKKCNLKKFYLLHLSKCRSKNFSCELCGRRFKAPEYVFRHMRQVHKIKGAFFDRIGSNEEHDHTIGLKKEIAIEGKTSNQSVIISCPICSQHFSDQYQVSHHVEAIHQMTMCTSCGMTFATTNQLNDHKLACPQHLKHVDSQLSPEEISQPHGETSSSGISNNVCPHCDKDCCHEALLVHHISWCHQPVVCETCGDTVSGRTRLKYHKMKCHSEPKLKCPYCSKKYHLKYEYQRHVNNHVQECKFPCKLCDRKFKNALAVKDHIRHSHSLKEFQTDLIDCNDVELKPQPYDDVNSLQGENMVLKMEIQVEETKLTEQIYSDEDRAKSPTITIISASELKTRKMKRRVKAKFSCSKCHQTFHRVRAFQTHVNGHMKKNDRKCPICGRIFEKIHRLEYHKRTAHTEPQHKCSHCPKMFHHMYSLRRHEVTHSNILQAEGSLTCDLCPKRFLDESSLQRHIVNAHPPTKLSCSMCDLKFTTRHKLSYHVKTIHTVPGFKCPDCGKLFNILQAFQRHKAAHLKTNQKSMRKSTETSMQQIDDDLEKDQHSFPQNVETLDCEKSPTYMISACQLATHKGTAPTEPQHKCSHCPKMFHHMSSLHRHEATHNNILAAEGSVVCDLCPERFPNESVLQRHTVKAHPPSEISCGMCDLKFTTPHKLKYHVKTIHTDPDFKCPDCGKLYSLQYAYRRHMATHLKAKQKKMSKSTEISEQRIDDELENK